MAKRGEFSDRTIALRERVAEMLAILGPEFKKEDFSDDYDLRDLYPKKTVLNNMLTRELHRLQALGVIKHGGKKGFYERVGK